MITSERHIRNALQQRRGQRARSLPDVGMRRAAGPCRRASWRSSAPKFARCAAPGHIAARTADSMNAVAPALNRKAGGVKSHSPAHRAFAEARARGTCRRFVRPRPACANRRRSQCRAAPFPSDRPRSQRQHVRAEKAAAHRFAVDGRIAERGARDIAEIVHRGTAAACRSARRRGRRRARKAANCTAGHPAARWPEPLQERPSRPRMPASGRAGIAGEQSGGEVAGQVFAVAGIEAILMCHARGE